MKDYSAMSDFEINKAVAESLGNRNVQLPAEYISGSVVSYMVSGMVGRGSYLNQDGQIEVKAREVRKDFCNNPADAWPIIVANKISILIDETVDYWSSALVHDFCDADAFSHGTSDNNPLRAAMIVFLMMEAKS